MFLYNKVLPEPAFAGRSQRGPGKIATLLFVALMGFGHHAALAESQSYSIDGALPWVDNFPDDFHPTISEDGRYVVYPVAIGSGLFDIYSARVDGSGSPVKLFSSMEPSSEKSFSISPDGSTVVVLCANTEIYSVAITGGNPVKISDTLISDGEIEGYLISPDSEEVVYLADQETDDVFELYSVALAGGSVTKISGTLQQPDGRVEEFRISPDSSSVIYNAPLDTSGMDELYAVPRDGGSATKLSAALVTGGDVHDFAVSDDGSRIVYRADQETDGVFELYSVAIADGSVTKLSGSMITSGDVYDFAISDDSSSVVYRADQETDEDYELYSVAITGGSVAKLSDSLITGGDVYNFAISADSSKVVYRADQDTDGIYELYAAEIDGGNTVKLNTSLTAGGDVYVFTISQDSEKVVYQADQETDTRIELYSVNIDGGNVIKLNDDVSEGVATKITDKDGSEAYLVSDDSKTVVYSADQDLDGVYELYSVAIGGGVTTKLNDSLDTVEDKGVWCFDITPDSSRVVSSIAKFENSEFTEYDLFGVRMKSAMSTLWIYLPGFIRGEQ